MFKINSFVREHAHLAIAEDEVTVDVRVRLLKKLSAVFSFAKHELLQATRVSTQVGGDVVNYTLVHGPAVLFTRVARHFLESDFSRGPTLLSLFCGGFAGLGVEKFI